MDENIYSERIHATLKARDQTGTWLAGKIGTTTANISRYMSGKSFPQALKYAAKIADALRVSTDYLLGVTDVMNPMAKDENTVKRFDDKYSHLF